MPKKILFLFLTGIFLSLNAVAELQDPTRPTLPFSSLDSSSGQEGSMQLNGILYSMTRPVAIIGDNIVHIDDTVENYKVTEIHRNSVVLTSSKGKALTLKMKVLDIKKPHI